MSHLNIHAESPAAAFVRDAACDLCGAHEVQLLATRDRRGAALRTVVCTRCGLISHESIPSDDELAHYYAHEYRQDYHGERRPSARRILRAWNVGQSIYRRVRPFVRPGDRVFEVGAGLGCTVKAFELGGFDAAGIEPGLEFQGFSRQVLHARIENARLEDVAPCPAFDFVLLVHVIEHFAHPTQALRRIGRLLRTGGRLYVECPNVYAPFAPPGQLFHYAHIHNFTPWTLPMLAEKCGFQLVQQLSRRDDGRLMFVLQKADTARLQIDASSYVRSVEAVQRYSTLTYHCRPRYALGRLQRLYWRLRGLCFVRRRVRRLIAEVDRHHREAEHPEDRLALLKAA